MGVTLKAIEYVLPENCITNDDLSTEFPNYDFSSFEVKVGIKQRYIVNEDETAFDLALKACEKLFLSIDRNQIDYILYCTQSPEYFLPTTACILQNKLNLNKNIGAFDFNLGCSGFAYGVSLAKSLIEASQAKNVLLVTAETYSKYLHPKDRSNRAIFGDGATASLISYSEMNNIGDFLFGTDGSGYDKLIVRNGASKNGFDFDPTELQYGTDNTYTDNNLYMNGPEVFNFTNQVIPDFTKQIVEKNGKTLNQISNFIFHQANSFMLNFMRKKLKIEKERFYIDLEDGGNTVSCTIPIALKKYSNNHNITQREDIVIVGFGVGLSWCGGMININGKL
jgi:3-oxoacyl-[acyl-carrier-protein] synthase-3